MLRGSGNLLAENATAATTPGHNFKDENGAVTSLDDLQKSREASAVSDESFLSFRRDRVSGAKTMTRDVLDIKTFAVTTEDAKFDEAFLEGTFQSLKIFAKQRNLQFKNADALEKHIEEVLKKGDRHRQERGKGRGDLRPG